MSIPLEDMPVSRHRDELVDLVRTLPDDVVALALELLRGLFVGAQLRHAAAEITWSCHACGEWRDDDKISLATATYPTRDGAEGVTRWRHCNDRPACKARAQEIADSVAERMARVVGGGRPSTR